MSFGLVCRLAPEAVNARLAMIGVIGLLVSELQGKGNVATQVQNNGYVFVRTVAS